MLKYEHVQFYYNLIQFIKPIDFTFQPFYLAVNLSSALKIELQFLKEEEKLVADLLIGPQNL